MSETVQRIMDIARVNAGKYMRLEDIGNRVGVTREYVRQIRKEAMRNGGWPLKNWQIHCHYCPREYLSDLLPSEAVLQAKETGWEKRNAVWMCPECGGRQARGEFSHSSWKEDWPKPDTLYGKILAWMESGKPYSAAEIARAFNIKHPHYVSRAKTALIVRGKWKWDVACLRGTERKYSQPVSLTDVLACPRRYPY